MNENQQERNQRAKAESARNEKRAGKGRIKTVIKIINKRKKTDESKCTGSCEQKLLLFVFG